MAQEANPRKATAGKVLNVTLAYVHVLKPFTTENGGDPKYSVVIIIPKDRTDTIAAIRAAVNAAYDDGVQNKWGGKAPSKATLHNPLRDGDVDRPGDPDFKGCYFLNASSKNRPGVIDTHGADLTEPGREDEVYSGMIAHVTFNMFAYDAKGNKGISCGLNNICKCGAGKFMGGRVSAASDFADELDSEFPEDNGPKETKSDDDWM